MKAAHDKEEYRALLARNSRNPEALSPRPQSLISALGSACQQVMSHVDKEGGSRHVGARAGLLARKKFVHAAKCADAYGKTTTYMGRQFVRKPSLTDGLTFEQYRAALKLFKEQRVEKLCEKMAQELTKDEPSKSVVLRCQKLLNKLCVDGAARTTRANSSLRFLDAEVRYNPDENNELTAEARFTSLKIRANANRLGLEVNGFDHKAILSKEDAGLIGKYCGQAAGASAEYANLDPKERKLLQQWVRDGAEGKSGNRWFDAQLARLSRTVNRQSAGGYGVQRFKPAFEAFVSSLDAGLSFAEKANGAYEKNVQALLDGPVTNSNARTARKEADAGPDSLKAEAQAIGERYFRKCEAKVRKLSNEQLQSAIRFVNQASSIERWRLPWLDGALDGIKNDTRQLTPDARWERTLRDARAEFARQLSLVLHAH
jgi:hypothetical protein